MLTQSLGVSDLKVTRIAFGCMPLGAHWDYTPLEEATKKQAVATLRHTLDLGINFFDHADIYCMGKSEEAFSAIWSEVPSLRSRVILQSKVGIRFPNDSFQGAPHRFDFSYEHIIQSVEGSLRRLKTDYLDVLLLHRPDPLVEPEEVARAFDELHRDGKVRWFGVSNHTAAQLALLYGYLKQPIVANQVAFNVIHTHMLDEGLLFNQDDARLTRNAGTIEYCRLHNITLQAWGPLAWGLVSGRKAEPPKQHLDETTQIVAEMAAEKGVSREAILVAWVLRHPAQVQAVIGTTNPERMAGSCQACEITLSREEWYRLYIAGRGAPLP